MEEIYADDTQTSAPPSFGGEVLAVSEVAQLLNLNPLKSSGKVEYHGPNPAGEGASDDGFILYAEGNAWDRSNDRRYTSVEVARMAGINPDLYEPCREYSKTKKGGFSMQGNNGTSPNGKPSPFEKKEPKPQKSIDTRTLQERGIKQSTMEHFGIRESKDSWQYPTILISGKTARYREKFFDPAAAGQKYNSNKKPMKYRWMPGDTSVIPKCYNMSAIRGAKEVWIVNGEVSVWSLHQCGMVAISPFGEGRMIEDIVKECQASHVKMLHIAFDNDDTGHKATYRAAQRAEALELEYVAYHIKGKDGADISDLYEQAGFDESRFLELVKSTPRVTSSQLAEWGDKPDTTEAKKESKSDSSNEKTAKAEQLGRMMMDIGARPFYTKEEDFYIIIPKEGIEQVYPMGDSLLGHRLYYHYFEHTGKMIDNSALDNAMRTLKGYALINNIKEEVWIRSAWHEGHIYVDLARDDGSVVKIGPTCVDGWEVINNPPVYFRRPKGFWDLPIPVRGGDINELRPLINGHHDEDWMMMLAWLVNSLFPPTASFPVLAINGEQGSAKSTTCRILKRLIDPNFTPMIGSSVREDRDLVITAKNCYVIGFDNLSKLAPWQSDALCQIATGQGFRTRKLHTDDEEILFNAKRPMIVNGIESIGREDFLNRCITVSLPPIPESRRREESEIDAAVDDIRPKVLGWIFDVMAHIIDNIDNVKLERSPRMVDFARRIVAGEDLMPWPKGQFLDTLMANRDRIIEAAVESSPLASEIMRLMEEKPFAEYTATDLMQLLNSRALPDNRNSAYWPKSASRLSAQLVRISPNLRQMGVDINRGSKGVSRFIKIRKMNEGEKF